MLKKLRHKKTAKWVWIVLAILILPAFVFWGAGSFIRDKKDRTSGYAGKIYSRQIPYAEYSDALNAVRNQAYIQFGDNLAELQKYLDLESQAWERLLLLTEAKRRKINANDKEVIEVIKSYPFFKRRGQFDSRLYKELLQYVFYDTQPRIFEEQTRQTIILSKLYKQLTDDIRLSDEEIKKEYEKANEEFSLYYIAALPDDFVKEVTVNDEALKSYFMNNRLDFKQPLTFNLEYVAADSQGKIQGLLPHLNKKEYLDKLIKDAGLTLKETGSFTEAAPVPGIGWSPQLLGLISKARAGQYLPPIQIDKAHYLFRVKERKEPYIPEFDKIKDKVKEKFINNRAKEIARRKIEASLEKITRDSKPADFDNIAKLFGLKSGSTALFKYGGYIEGIGASDNFWIKAKDLKADQLSDIISLPSGFYIIRLKSRVPVDEKKFRQESAEFAKRLLMQKKQDRFAALIEELQKNLQRFQENRFQQ